MQKVIRDGKVAVLYSPGYGAGWSSWGAPLEAIFHPKLVELVESGNQKLITRELCQELFKDEWYLGGAEDLSIEWLSEGTAFEIDEYDGSESVRVMMDAEFIIA